MLKSTIANDIMLSMESELMKTAEPVDLEPAINSLHSAAEILDSIKLHASSDKIIHLLTKIASTNSDEEFEEEHDPFDMDIGLELK